MKYSINIDERLSIADPEKTCSFPVYVRLAGDFNEATCLKFRTELAHAEHEAIESKQEILPIIIDSYGGEVYSLLSCVDAINSVDKSLKVATIVEGKAMSCGAALLTCGHEGYRFAGKNSTIMIHEVSSWHYGKNEELKSSAKETDRLNELIMKIMSENCGHSKGYFEKEITKRKHADWFLEPKEAVEHNIVNHIGIPKFDINVTMAVKFAVIGDNGKVFTVNGNSSSK